MYSNKRFRFSRHFWELGASLDVGKDPSAGFCAARMFMKCSIDLFRMEIYVRAKFPTSGSAVCAVCNALHLC